jgi:aerobic carbon-monoxide dehydrogenase medium subunit
MYAFEYRRAQNLQDAKHLLAEREDSRPLAGGQTLLPTLKQRLARPARIVDLRYVNEMHGIAVSSNKVSIGATTCHAAVAASVEVARAIPALAALAGGIGDPLVRNMGTIGGSLANSDPAADYPGAVMGLGAIIHTDRRSISAEDFFRGMFSTALEAEELIVRIEFPIPKRAGYIKFANPASGYVMVGAFVAQTSGGARVAINGAGPCVFRHAEMEQALTKRFDPRALEDIATPAEGLNSDLHAGAAYRAHLVGVMARRATAVAAV